MTYFDTIQAALWAKPIDQTPMSEDLVQLHMRQGTGTMVFPLVPMTAPMKMVCMQNIQQQVKLQYILHQAWTALTNAGIHPVLMKGAGLAALYPEPQMRTWGDIDLFVGIDQYHPACKVMRDTFPDALKFDEELDHYKHYNLIADGISIEVHRVSVGFQHPIDARRYARMEAYAVQHACEVEIGDLTVKIFEPTFNALFVMLHSWEHMTTQGASVRQLCDWTLLLHRYADRMDIPRLKGWLKQLHLLDIWHLYAYIAVNFIGLSLDKIPLYNNSERVKVRAEKLLKDLLAGKMVAPKPSEQAPKGRFARKWHTMQERLRNADRIGLYSPAYGRHMKAETWLHGALRLFAKDRHWE